jgi:hypothetical protein
MTPEEWIERYRRAWETADEVEIVDLFTSDASYRTSVFREPYVGSAAIRQYWQRGAGLSAKSPSRWDNRSSRPIARPWSGGRR